MNLYRIFIIICMIFDTHTSTTVTSSLNGNDKFKITSLSVTKSKRLAHTKPYDNPFFGSLNTPKRISHPQDWQYMQLRNRQGLYYHPIKKYQNVVLPKYFSTNDDSYGKKYVLLRHEDEAEGKLLITYTLLERLKSQPVNPLYSIISINKKVKQTGHKISYAGESNGIFSTEVKMLDLNGNLHTN